MLGALTLEALHGSVSRHTLVLPTLWGHFGMVTVVYGVRVEPSEVRDLFVSGK